MTENDDSASRPYSRRKFLGQVGAVGAVGAAGIAGPMVGGAAAGAATPKVKGPTLLGKAKRTSPIKTIVVSIQENHSFDHYFGAYLAAKLPKGYGVPAGYTMPDGSGKSVAPFHFTDLTDGNYDPNHDW